MSHHSLSNVFVHIVWATHRRQKIIHRGDDERLHQLLRSVATALRCEIVSAGNASDHVHGIARVSPTIALADLVRRLKGRTSFVGGWSWQRGYFAESIGIADLEPIARYLQRQRDHHDDSHPSESWIVRDCESAEGGLEP